MSLDNEGFRKRIKEYRIHFQLTQQEVATFMGWAQADYSNLENGKRIVDLDTVNLIASIYGFKGWQFTIADTTIPKIENLPKETRTLVEEKLASGRTVRNTTVQLPKEIKKVLVSGKLPSEFTSIHVFNNFPDDIKGNINLRRITDNLSRGACSKLVVDLNKKKGTEKLFSLK